MDQQLKRKHTWGTGARFIASLFLTLLVAACGGGPGSTTSTQTPTHAPAVTVNVPQQDTPTPTTTSLVAWPSFNGGGARSGVNTSEHIISRGNVGQLTRLWQQTLPDVADSSIVEQPGINTAGGTRTLLFVTTKSGNLLALDAATGQTVWRRDSSGPKITNSSPALDPSGRFVYSYGLDGKVHRYAVGSGAEVTGSGWPATMTLMTQDEKGGTAINISNGYFYMGIGGYVGDAGHYQGHVVAVNLATGRTTIFNTLCATVRQLLNNVPTAPNYCAALRSAVWSRAGAVIDPLTGNVFIATGNGPFDANTGGHDYGDSVLELSPDLSRLIDTYTPNNYMQLDAQDADLGSASPALLPRQNGSRTPYLAVQAGKDQKLRLLNRQNLSGRGGPNHVGGEVQSVSLPQGCAVLTQPAVWNDPTGVTWVFVANDCGFSAFKVVTSNGVTRLQLAYQNKVMGSSPYIANGVLFVQGNNVLYALAPTTGTILWSSALRSAGGSIGELHWQSPLIVNGHVYAVDMNGHITAYGFK